MTTQANQPQGDPFILSVSPLLLQSPFGPQQVLFHHVHHDDVVLLEQEDNAWLRVVRELDWKAYRQTAARYYQALWEFNTAAALKRQAASSDTLKAWPEDEQQASLRLLMERPTGGNTEASILHPTPVPPQQTPTVTEELMAPGVVPFRMAGKEPKCFFAMLKAFLALSVMGKPSSAEEAYHHLKISPAFARACGFTIPDAKIGYRRSDFPSLRKLEQFDQIMSDRGLWSELTVRTVRDNLASGAIPVEGQRLAHDTTHYIAYSAMGVIEIPCQAASPAAQDAGTSQSPVPAIETSANNSEPPISTASAVAGKNSAQTKRKSQSRTVKNCRCEDRLECPHPWGLSDPGAGTVVKGAQTGGKRMYWAHKAAVFSITPLGVPLDVVAMSDAASHDGNSLRPHLRRLFQTYSELRGRLTEVVADTAYDDADEKKAILEEFGIRVLTDVNPRSRKTQTTDLGRGMKSLSPAGTLTCEAEREMTYLGMRHAAEQFIYGPPGIAKGHSACLSCPLRQDCCRQDNQTGRHVAIPFTRLPHINVEDPPMARRFKAIMRLRPVIERTIKRLKLDFGDDHLTRRGNNAFQAHLDRSLIALHLVLRLG